MSTARSIALGLVVAVAACDARSGVRAPPPSPPPPSRDAGSVVDAGSVRAPEPAPGETLIHADGRFVAAARVREGVDPAIEKRILDATFRRYLRKECPKIPGIEHAKTWGELDDWNERARASGLVRPKVVDRVEGHFTARDVPETLLMVDEGNCVNAGYYDRVYAIFATSAIVQEDALPKLRGRVETHDFVMHRIRGVVDRGGLDVLIVTANESPNRVDARPVRVAPDATRAGWSLVEGDRLAFDPTCSVVLTAPTAPLGLRTLSCAD